MKVPLAYGLVLTNGIIVQYCTVLYSMIVHYIYSAYAREIPTVLRVSRIVIVQTNGVLMSPHQPEIIWPKNAGFIAPLVLGKK